MKTRFLFPQYWGFNLFGVTRFGFRGRTTYWDNTDAITERYSSCHCGINSCGEMKEIAMKSTSGRLASVLVIYSRPQRTDKSRQELVSTFVICQTKFYNLWRMNVGIYLRRLQGKMKSN